MSITLSDLKIYGSATMPDSDTPTQIGGAIATAKTVEFTDVGGAIQVVSSSSGDTTQKVTVSYRDSSGSLLSEQKTLNGQTPVAFAATPERLLKALKDISTDGDVAVEGPAVRSGTPQDGGSVNTIKLDSGASAVDQAYAATVLRITSGLKQIRRIIDYVGTTKVATLDHNWDAGFVPDSSSSFRISQGFFFEKRPIEVTEVRRAFYDAAADSPGGAARAYHEKVFVKNAHGSLSLLAAAVKEHSDPSGLIDFGLTAALDDSTTNGVGNNRLIAPSGITFNSADKSVIGGALGPGSTQGVWLRLSLPAGQAAQNTSYVLKLTGNTV